MDGSEHIRDVCRNVFCNIPRKRSERDGSELIRGLRRDSSATVRGNEARDGNKHIRDEWLPFPLRLGAVVSKQTGLVLGAWGLFRVKSIPMELPLAVVQIALRLGDLGAIQLSLRYTGGLSALWPYSLMASGL